MTCFNLPVFFLLHFYVKGEKGIGSSGKPLHYKGSGFHRIIPQASRRWEHKMRPRNPSCTHAVMSRSLACSHA